MPTSSAKLDREVAILLAGDAELEGRASEGQAIRKQSKTGARGGYEGGPLLGYTRSKKAVHGPTRGAPKTNDVTVFQRTKAKFSGWTKADHMDAARLLDQAAETLQFAGDGKAARHYRGWSSVHWDIGGRWTSPEADAYYASAE